MTRDEFTITVGARAIMRREALAIRQHVDAHLPVLEAARKCVAHWDADTLSIICAETDDAGKALYTNAERRQAELMIRQDASPPYAELTREVYRLECEIARRRDEIEDRMIEAQSQSAIIDYELAHPTAQLEEDINRIHDNLPGLTDRAAGAAVRRAFLEFGMQFSPEEKGG